MGKGLFDLLVDAISDMYWTDERTGKFGEKLTERKLKMVNFFGRKGKTLKNVYIPKDNGETSEIDLVYITQKGIFVIESKNYSGWIFGDAYSKYWTASLPNGEKNRFYSPVKQNRTHIKWLNNYLSYYASKPISMYSIIVFSNRCELKKVPADSQEAIICQRDSLYWKIRNMWEYLPNILTDSDIEITYNLLYPLTNVSEALKQTHIDNINKNHLNHQSYQTFSNPTPVAQQSIHPEFQQNPSFVPQQSVPPEFQQNPLPVPQEIVPPEYQHNPSHVPQQSVHPEFQQNPVSATQPAPVPQTTSAPRCPRCGGLLVLRTAKKGTNAGNQFYGCSSFPKCRYIKNL